MYTITALRDTFPPKKNVLLKVRLTRRVFLSLVTSAGNDQLVSPSHPSFPLKKLPY